VARRPLPHDELLELLGELAETIDASTDKPVELRIVGGAAIAAAYNPDREGTDDVDGLEATDVEAVLLAAEAVAARHGLEPDWVNFKVRMYAPDPIYPAPEWEHLLSRGSVRIAVGEPELLLAMKIRAGRPNRDFPDIDTLLAACGITRYDEAREVFERHYTTDVMKPIVESFLRSRLS
jgi:hypothetical protein